MVGSMCGHAGIISSKYVQDEGLQTRMLSSISHRGPDDSTKHLFSRCALLHRRLSIVDLANGKQPMLSECGRVAIVFNGEIYGFKEMRSRLKNFRFRTDSDTEVILNSYLSHDTSFVPQLPGMFSFAIWDDRQQRLFAARDRFGEKPFYYSILSDGTFLFGSEIKALLSSNLFTPKLRLSSVRHFLQKLYVHPFHTIYENVFCLPPGHTLMWKEGKVSVERFWHPPEATLNISLEEAALELSQLLAEAVRKQLVADVPVASLLSGGLDSTTITGIASKIDPLLRTFSFGFEGANSELKFAQLAASQFKTKHFEFFESGIDYAALLKMMDEIYDEPFADSSNIPTYLLCKSISQHAKVALTGDGGDELFGGYCEWYSNIEFLEAVNRSRVNSKQLLFGASLVLKMINSLIPSAIVRRTSKGIDFCYRTHSISDPYLAHGIQNIYFQYSDLLRLGLSESYFEEDDSTNNWGAPPSPRFDGLNAAMFRDMTDYLPGDLLVKTDRAAMACGLELRSPFLDVNVSDFVLKLPSSFKFHSGRSKIILRQAFEGSWPESIRSRPKQGFGVPVQDWLRKPSIQELRAQYLRNERNILVEGLNFKAKTIQEIDSKSDYKTWILLVLSIWLDRRRENIKIS